MLESLAYLVTRVICHKTSSKVYKSHDINFLQEFDSFFRTASIPQWDSNIPYFLILIRGCNDEVYERYNCTVVLFLSSHNT